MKIQMKSKIDNLFN